MAGKSLSFVVEMPAYEDAEEVDDDLGFACILEVA